MSKNIFTTIFGDDYKNPFNIILNLLAFFIIIYVTQHNSGIKKALIDPRFWIIIAILFIVRWGTVYYYENIEDKKVIEKTKKPLNQIQKICILVVVACSLLWVGFGDGFRPEYSLVSFAIGITSIVAFFLFKDKWLCTLYRKYGKGLYGKSIYILNSWWLKSFLSLSLL